MSSRNARRRRSKQNRRAEAAAAAGGGEGNANQPQQAQQAQRSNGNNNNNNMSRSAASAESKSAAAGRGGETLGNFVGGKWVPIKSGETLDVVSPTTKKVIGRVGMSNAADVDAAVKAARAAFPAWSGLTSKARVQYLIRFHQLMVKHTEELAALVTLEHGKNLAESRGGVAKGNETVEYAIAMPQLLAGKFLQVSRGVTCHEESRPLGVVASVVPFNFPAMCPMWTLPIAIATGNCIIVKPSEKVPLTMARMADLLREAGIPDGVVSVVNGGRAAVEGLVDHPGVDALTFVGSSKVAEIVSHRASKLNKRVLALGGAKNHLVTLPDCKIDMAAEDIVNSFTGCTGQRCMAASVLLTVGEQKDLVNAVVAKAKARKAGDKAREIGPVIDQEAVDRIHRYIAQSEEKFGAKILLDGRPWSKQHPEGFFVGPTVILHSDPADPALHEEIFGPVISIYQVKTREEAIAFENANPYGNAAAIYTSSGDQAQWFTARFSAGMLGVNVGVPVPREPFAFGGINRSKFGGAGLDITADGGVQFFTKRVKTTTKWIPPKVRSWMD